VPLASERISPRVVEFCDDLSSIHCCATCTAEPTFLTALRLKGQHVPRFAPLHGLLHLVCGMLLCECASPFFFDRDLLPLIVYWLALRAHQIIVTSAGQLKESSQYQVYQLGPECLTSEPLNQSSSSPLSLYLLYKSEPFPLFFSLFLSSLINQLLSLLIIILLNVCKSLFSSTSDQSQNEVFIHYLPFYSSRRRSFCSKLKAQSICHYQ